MWWLLVWRKEYQNCKIRAAWRHTLWQIVQKLCLRAWATSAEAWMACKQMIMDLMKAEAEQMYEKQKQERVTATLQRCAAGYCAMWESKMHGYL